jgi:serine/threonine protein kinase
VVPSNDIRAQLQSALGTSYTLEGELDGGMSRVFVAHEPRLGRRVVVKVLAPEHVAGVSVERFDREIQLAGSLQQANIVPVLTAGEVAGLPYYTTPYVDGDSRRARLAGGPLPIAEAVSVLTDVARALADAHRHGVVHRDVKPDNILVSGGTAVVTDFGIGKALAASRAPAADETITQDGPRSAGAARDRLRAVCGAASPRRLADAGPHARARLDPRGDRREASPHVSWRRTACWGASALGAFATVVAVVMAPRGRGMTARWPQHAESVQHGSSAVSAVLGVRTTSRAVPDRVRSVMERSRQDAPGSRSDERDAASAARRPTWAVATPMPHSAGPRPPSLTVLLPMASGRLAGMARREIR